MEETPLGSVSSLSAKIEASEIAAGTDTPTTSAVISVADSGVEGDTQAINKASGVAASTESETQITPVLGVADSGIEEHMGLHSVGAYML